MVAWPIGVIDSLLSRGGMDSHAADRLPDHRRRHFRRPARALRADRQARRPDDRAAKSTGRLFATVFGCAFGLNVLAGDQYIALVLPARVFRLEFQRRDLAATNLSRLAADSGTVSSPLVPWNSCGAFMGAVLGVPTLSYLPYCVLNYASPALSVLYGITGFKVEKLDPSTSPPPTRARFRTHPDREIILSIS